jgi:hypothetical protein
LPATIRSIPGPGPGHDPDQSPDDNIHDRRLNRIQQIQRIVWYGRIAGARTRPLFSLLFNKKKSRCSDAGRHPYASTK